MPRRSRHHRLPSKSRHRTPDSRNESVGDKSAHTSHKESRKSCNSRRERSDSKDSSFYRRYDGRDRNRSRSKSSRLRSRENSPLLKHRFCGNDDTLHSTLSDIMTKLNAIEHANISNNLLQTNQTTTVENPAHEVTSRPNSLIKLTDVPQRVHVDNSEGDSTTIRIPDPTVRGSDAPSAITLLADAIKSLQPVRSRNFYVSNFDPSIHDIDVWCEEVDRAIAANGWSDYECLSRVASCLKGDAKVWLNEWVTNDRTWSNFKIEFKPLCLRKLDYANILFETMNTTSDKYPTYAEYARRTLLRLRIVKGLTDELRTLIVIRGIDNPQVRAAAAKANRTKVDPRESSSKKKRLPLNFSTAVNAVT